MIDPETRPYNSSSPRSPSDEPDWENAPAMMTTREASELLTVAKGSPVSTANVRTRIGRGEFPNAAEDADGRNLIPKADVQAVYQRFAKERTSRNEIVRRFAHGVSPPAQTLQQGELMQTGAALMERFQQAVQEAVQREREAVQEARTERDSLRALLISREETTRETLTHMDALHEARRAEQLAAKDAEIERLREELEKAKKPRKLFGWGS